MYQLDLSDRRLALPVAIYETPSGPGLAARLVPRGHQDDREAMPPRRIAFFAPDRAGIASLPVYEDFDAKNGQTLRVGSATATRPADTSGTDPLFFLLPADLKDYTAATVPLHEYQQEGASDRIYSVDARSPAERSRWRSKVLGRVWRNPSRQRLW
jgi:hypothetical protein